MALCASRLRGDRIFKAAASGAVFALAMGALWLLFYRFLRPEDLANMFLPAARAMLAGRSPYEIYGFYGPPWALAPVLLVAWLPDQMAGAAFAVLSIGTLVWFFKAREIAPGQAAPLLLSLPIVASVMYGNLEPFVLLALIAPRPLGLVLLAMKPHMGAVLGLFWLLDEFRAGGVRAVARLLWPVALLTGLSVLAYGFWPAIWLDTAQGCNGWGWNVWAWMPWAAAHPWAHVFILGIPATFYALYREDPDLAMGAGTLVSPYTSILNLAAWVPRLSPRRRWDLSPRRRWDLSPRRRWDLSRARPWIVWLLCLASWALAPLRPF